MRSFAHKVGARRANPVDFPFTTLFQNRAQRRWQSARPAGVPFWTNRPMTPCSQASQLLWPGLTPHARASPASAPRLPDAGQRLAPLVRREVSRFPSEERPYMLGSLTAPDRSATRVRAAGRIAFRPGNAVGIRDKGLTRLNGQPACSPADASPCPHRTRRMARGRCESFVESFRCSTLVLWDETQKRLISFRELRMRRSDLPMHRVLADRRSSRF